MYGGEVAWTAGAGYILANVHSSHRERTKLVLVWNREVSEKLFFSSRGKVLCILIQFSSLNLFQIDDEARSHVWSQT
jgi:hypothetical protein